METEKVLSQLTKAVSYVFRKDATSPGVVVSNLKTGQVYASVVRYGSTFASGKQVVCKVTARDLNSAVVALSNEFLNTVKQEQNPVDTLRSLVK